MTSKRPEFNRKARIGAVASAVAGLMFVVSADAQAASRFESGAWQQIQSYCNASWRNSRIPDSDWDDCTQQVFLELLERMPEADLVRSINESDSEQRRELNRAIWRISKRVSRETTLLPLNGYDVAERQSSDQYELQHQQRQQVSEIASDKLGSRQSQIVDRLLKGQSIGEIANALNTSAARISDAKYRAIKKIRELV